MGTAASTRQNKVAVAQPVGGWLASIKEEYKHKTVKIAVKTVKIAVKSSRQRTLPAAGDYMPNMPRAPPSCFVSFTNVSKYW